MAAKQFSASELREKFDYDPETGVLTYRTHVQKSLVGRHVGCDVRRGYKRLRINRKWFLVHRVVWAMQTGEWPDMIDHINGDRQDNRWCNLRATDPFLNAQNRTKPERGNKVGVLGVTKRGGRFVAKITRNGQQFFVGQFADAEQARVAYLAAKARLHPHAFLVSRPHQSPTKLQIVDLQEGIAGEFDWCRGGQP